MQHKDTSQQAFLIIYLMCILSFIYFSLGRSRWVFFQTIRLMSDSEVKTGALLWFRNSSTSSCLCHSSCLCLLTLLVCVSSLFLSVSPHSSCLSLLTLLVCVTSLFLSVSPHSSCLFSSLFLSVSPHSSCLCHLTLLVCVSSLFLSVSSLFLSVSPHSCQSSLHVIN